MRKIYFNVLLGLIMLAAFSLPLYAESEKQASAETDVQKLGKKLQNPVAKLMSVPFQNNFEHKLGPEKKGHRYTLRFQPVIPMSLNDDWNFILRPIVPQISQNHVVGSTKQEGLGDIEVQSSFSPKEPGPGGIIWGVGPVLLFPTASSDHLGSQKWGIGPHSVILKQTGPWTMVFLADHTWSYSGNDKRKDISATYLQPILAHTSKKGFTIVASSESTYDWKGQKERRWSIPLIGSVSQIFSLCGHYASVGVGGIYYPQAPTGGPRWGIRFSLTFLFPQGLQQPQKVK